MTSHSNRRPRRAVPIALTIAGSDSGGGAGIQADLHTFAALGVHGTTAVTCLTAQNPRGVSAIQAVTPKFLSQQLEMIQAELPPRAAKTGMLYSAALIRTVAAFFENGRDLPLVVDPVMVATSGARLLKSSALRELMDRLLPCATLVTPNLPEAEWMLQRRLRTEEDLRAACRVLVGRFGCAALLKGGHLPGTRTAVDIFFDGQTELLLTAPFIRGVTTHGTGCTYASAITAYLARGLELPEAVAQAKTFITTAIASSQRVAAHSVLNWQRAEGQRNRLRNRGTDGSSLSRQRPRVGGED